VATPGCSTVFWLKNRPWGIWNPDTCVSSGTVAYWLLLTTAFEYCRGHLQLYSCFKIFTFSCFVIVFTNHIVSLGYTFTCIAWSCLQIISYPPIVGMYIHFRVSRCFTRRTIELRCIHFTFLYIVYCYTFSLRNRVSTTVAYCLSAVAR
jgi:ACR3 family arsenite efflux pump ArsB